MAWLRIDDGFAQHPKIVQLSAKDRWTWLELLCYCARYRTEGQVPGGIAEVVRGCTPAFLTRCGELRLLDKTGEDLYEIHDWIEYNPARIDDIDEAVETFLTEQPDASANDAWRALGGSRKLVLAAVKRYRVGTTAVPPTGTRTGTNGGTGTGTEPVTRARSRPVPSPSTTPTAAAGTTPDAAAALLTQLDDLGLNGTALELALAEPDRAQAWINLATTEAKTNPSGFVLAGLKSKAWPATRKTTTTHQTKTALQMTRARQRIEDDWHTLDQTGLDIELTDLGIPHADRTPLYELAERVRGERCPPS